MTGPPPTRLHVLADATGDPGRWAGFVAGVAALTGLEPLVSARPRDGGDLRRQRLLEWAAATTDPVLVLPVEPADRSTVTEPPRLRRALVPIDRSLSERRTLRAWIERAQAAGVEIEQLHVLGEANRPRIWEGPGHHAEAWLAGLRRHQVGDAVLRVRSGEPAAAIVSAIPSADLLLICWKGDPAADRAHVLRAVLGRLERPVLLVRGAPPAVTGSLLALPT